MNLFVNPAICHIDRIMYFCHVAQMSHCINATNHKNRTCCESVTMAKMSRQYGIYVFTESLQICHVVKMSRQCCKYVLSNQLPKCHCDLNVTSSVIKMSRCPNTTDPLQWKMTPPVENDRDPLRGNYAPLQWKMRVNPPMEIILLTPPRELC